MPAVPKICDLSAARARMGGNLRLLEQVIEFYREDAPLILGKLRTAIAAGDVAKLQLATHSLRGLVVNFDAEAAAQATRRLEHLGQVGELKRAVQAASELEEEISRLDAALTAELAKQRASM